MKPVRWQFQLTTGLTHSAVCLDERLARTISRAMLSAAYRVLDEYMTDGHVKCSEPIQVPERGEHGE